MYQFFIIFIFFLIYTKENLLIITILYNGLIIFLNEKEYKLLKFIIYPSDITNKSS